jgi:hypothetical protein
MYSLSLSLSLSLSPSVPLLSSPLPSPPLLSPKSKPLKIRIDRGIKCSSSEIGLNPN